MNFFKDFDVNIINCFSLSHTIKRNLTKLVYVRKEKNPNLKIFTGLCSERTKTPKLRMFMSSLFHGKNREI